MRYPDRAKNPTTPTLPGSMVQRGIGPQVIRDDAEDEEGSHSIESGCPREACHRGPLHGDETYPMV
jgi:hypothetical protein